MGYIRKLFLSPMTLGSVHYESKKEKALRESKTQSKIQKQMLEEQKRANDLKERELALKYPTPEDPPTDEERREMFPDAFNHPKDQQARGKWWGYSKTGRGK